MSWVLWIIGAAVVVVGGLFLFRWLAPQKCPRCKVKMRLLSTNCGKTKKLECPKCKHRVDTGIPTGRGKR
ncbi:MAG: hypothetical protein JXQ29_13190 [Planctomycetes bacterium]|nr:hypothetical protein [Planctomycetota bacterium]